MQWVHLALFLCHEAKHIICCRVKNAWCPTSSPTYFCLSCAQIGKLLLNIWSSCVLFPKCVPCHHWMTLPQAVDGQGRTSQIWRVAANKDLWTVDWGWLLSLEIRCRSNKLSLSRGRFECEIADADLSGQEVTFFCGTQDPPWFILRE